MEGQMDGQTLFYRTFPLMAGGPNNSFWTLGQEPQYKIFPTKYTPVNFEHLGCCDFMQKIRKVSCINFS